MQIVSVIDRAARQWVRVSLSGEIVSATSTAILRSGLGALLRSRPKGISIDLGGVGTIDDHGLAEFRRAVLQAADDGVWFEVVNAPLPVHRRLSADPVLAAVLEAYAWRRPSERAQLAGQRGRGTAQGRTSGRSGSGRVSVAR